MTPESLAAAIQNAQETLRLNGLLAIDGQLPTPAVERPRNPDHGDYATNIAMVLAKRASMSPRELADAFAEQLRTNDDIESVDIAGPGFINITLATAAQGVLAEQIVEKAEDFGRGDLLAGTSFDVEFISANPTGPLHLGHTRWAAVGDALARVLTAAGAQVSKEFYVNDRGAQMDNFGLSIANAAEGKPPPEDGYHGAYIVELASEIIAEHPEYADLTGRERFEAFREAGYERQFREHQQVLDMFRTHFDVWTSERELHRSGAVEAGLNRLRDQGHVYEADGALWLRTTSFGDDKDRVLIKADGELTYFASDTAYYIDKRRRGFDVCVYLLGADHHGYVGRLRAVAACAGDDPEQNIEIPIGQLVKMMKGGQEVRLSKRAGNIVTLDEVVAEVGVDAARYQLIRYPVDSPLTLDLDLLVKRSNDNPVYYVQYAHARISSVLRNAAALGIDWRATSLDPGLLGQPAESALLGALAEFPGIVAGAAELREPHRVARYLEDLATAYHKFYDSCRVLPRGDAQPDGTSIARLWLCAATRQVLANGLDLCGVSAPEQM
ncbi:MAG: arginine--tRNA ligase [Micrococcales bacterium]|nr:arginine--tRNA ligase [Micrococcales bacterium]